MSKLPVDPGNRLGHITQIKNGRSFETIINALHLNKLKCLAGIGFMLTGKDNLTGIDIYDCIEEGVTQPEAKEIIKKID